MICAAQSPGRRIAGRGCGVWFLLPAGRTATAMSIACG